MKRTGLIAAALAGVITLGLWAWAWRAPSGPQTIVMVVLDTVRADHLGVCGYARPTTPTLAGLVAEGAALSCRTYAAGSWTLPSHASMFTGEPVLTHRCHEITNGVTDMSGTAAKTSKLDDTLPTLAEQLSERGYRTVMISANPVVNLKLGLARGFETVVTAKRFGKLRGSSMVAEVQRQLGQPGDDPRPLFLFVNLTEAHQPWEDVPADVSWLRQRKAPHYNKAKPKAPWTQFVTGSMKPARRRRLVARARDSYDWGVYRADRTLGEVLEAVRGAGFCRAGCRTVVTSDHGEFLGEHQLLDHGHYTYEPNARVFMLLHNSAGPAPALPEAPISGLHAFHLVRDGVLPEVLAPVVGVAWPHVRRCARTDGAAFCQHNAALWQGDRKLLWMESEGWFEQDLSRPDANDGRRTPLAADDPSRPALQQLVDDVKSQSTGQAVDDGSVIEMLRAAGYVE